MSLACYFSFVETEARYNQSLILKSLYAVEQGLKPEQLASKPKTIIVFFENVGHFAYQMLLL